MNHQNSFSAPWHHSISVHNTTEGMNTIQNLILHKSKTDPQWFISKMCGVRCTERVFFIFVHFLFLVRGWQLSLEQAGTCITANERQWICTLVTFQQPME